MGEILVYVLNTYPWKLASTVAIFGLLVGSFLNVVIVRLPQMMLREWEESCRKHLLLSDESADNNDASSSPLSLTHPPSHCPQCKHKVRWIENIPIVSYIALRGKCSACKKTIPIRYPIIEFLSGAIAFAIAFYYGLSTQGLFLIIYCLALLVLTCIDLDHKLLPDQITLPFLWLGLVVNSFGVFVPLKDALYGAIMGYLIFWMVFHVFRLITGKQGMGYGDFKLLAMIGAWVGWTRIPEVILISSVLAVIVGLSMIFFLGHKKENPIPYGPYLAFAGVIAIFMLSKNLMLYG